MPVLLIVCPACDLAHKSNEDARERTRCTRCGATLEPPTGARVETALALTLCAVLLFAMSNAFPLVDLVANGASRQATLVGAAIGLYYQGYAALACLVFLTTFVAPLAQIGSLVYLLVPLRRHRRPHAMDAVMRIVVFVRPWTFVEVFMLGSLVALVRLSAFAQVVPGISLASYGLFMLCLVALAHLTPPQQLWRWAEGSTA